MLRLRPLGPDDEAAFLAGQDALAAEGHNFGPRLEPGTTWNDYLRMLADNRAGVNLPERLVPSTFLVADVDGQFVGRVTIRHRLNEFLRVEGGHIGYNVLPGFRRRGHATEILRQALIVARSMGIDRVLVTTDDDNVGSIAVIESNGGKLDSVRPATGTMPAHRLYWID
ncbi:MAG TPA: GNAT family N-acetyltransferase [Streptosporangiaceae bacterium]|jgi:predicted acetyltransferase|nr:GNAT family N-acetyltransferase [Streptosporangiaceae bacterium]